MPTTVAPTLSLLAAALAALVAPAVAQTAASAAIPIAVDYSNPPAITFSWPADATATGYTVARRFLGTTAWGVTITIPGAGATTSWTDSTVVLGVRFEYLFNKNGSPAAKTLLAVGLDAPLIDSRGIVVLLVDDTEAGPLGVRLDRLQQDLAGDGWIVQRHDVSPVQSVPSVKALIAADVAANPTQVKAVFLLGRVPVPYSGSLAPDGHPDHQGCWPADVYYGELDGPWTDTSVNITTATRLENRNVPGDGKFDQTTIPSDVDLAVGRVDLANMPAFALSETQLLQQYLDKDHDYRHKVFAADQRAVIDDNFGWFGGEAFAASGWRNFAALLGPANITQADYFATLDTTSGGGYVWSYGCGGGTYTSAGGIGATTDFATSHNRCVFTMLFGSYFGDWDSTDNFLRAPLCQGWTLADVWAGRPHWSFHTMAMGDTIGACARLSQNDTIAGGFGQRYVHLALMGDPTLRQHVVAPPANVAIADAWPQANVTWTASSDPVAGYHVYRASAPAGAFARLTTNPVAATSFTDPSALAGSSTYQVRAVRLETTPTGTYWNASQGAFASTSLPTQAAAHTIYGAGCSGLALAASPPPVSTTASGTLVTYTVSNVPEAAPSSGVYLGLTIVSLTQDAAGTPLASLGMPGCSLWVGALDLTTAFVGSSPTQTTGFQIPAAVPGGTRVFATAVALVTPGTINAFGAVTSNGVASFVNNF
jgi:hypothetical protein